MPDPYTKNPSILTFELSRSNIFMRFLTISKRLFLADKTNDEKSRSWNELPVVSPTSAQSYKTCITIWYHVQL